MIGWIVFRVFTMVLYVECSRSLELLAYVAEYNNRESWHDRLENARFENGFLIGLRRVVSARRNPSDGDRNGAEDRWLVEQARRESNEGEIVRAVLSDIPQTAR